MGGSTSVVDKDQKNDIQKSVEKKTEEERNDDENEIVIIKNSISRLKVILSQVRSFDIDSNLKFLHVLDIFADNCSNSIMNMFVSNMKEVIQFCEKLCKFIRSDLVELISEERIRATCDILIRYFELLKESRIKIGELQSQAKMTCEYTELLIGFCDEWRNKNGLDEKKKTYMDQCLQELKQWYSQHSVLEKLAESWKTFSKDVQNERTEWVTVIKDLKNDRMYEFMTYALFGFAAIAVTGGIVLGIVAFFSPAAPAVAAVAAAAATAATEASGGYVLGVIAACVLGAGFGGLVSGHFVSKKYQLICEATEVATEIKNSLDILVADCINVEALINTLDNQFTKQINIGQHTDINNKPPQIVQSALKNILSLMQQFVKDSERLEQTIERAINKYVDLNFEVEK